MNDPNLGGVIEHQFDGQEDQGDGGRGDRRWLPCRALLCPVVPCRGAAKSWTALSWCGAYRDRFACSIINARHSGIVQQRGRANFSHVSSRSTARGRTTAARGEKRRTTSAFQPPRPTGHTLEATYNKKPKENTYTVHCL